MSKSHEHPQALADRYVAVWNETDPATRRDMIAALFAADGVHYVGTREARGHAALESRIVGSYEKNVRDRGNRFRAVPNAQALRDAVTFNWEMVAPDGRVLAVGLELILRGEHGIITDYQFNIA